MKEIKTVIEFMDTLDNTDCVEWTTEQMLKLAKWTAEQMVVEKNIQIEPGALIQVENATKISLNDGWRYARRKQLAKIDKLLNN